jgi:hypothetical protein
VEPLVQTPGSIRQHHKQRHQQPDTPAVEVQAMLVQQVLVPLVLEELHIRVEMPALMDPLQKDKPVVVVVAPEALELTRVMVLVEPVVPV